MAKVNTNKSLIVAETNYIKEVIRHAIAFNDKNATDEEGKPYCAIYAALHKESVDNIQAMGIQVLKKKTTHHNFYLPKRGTKTYERLMDGSDVVARAKEEKEVRAAAIKAAKAEKVAKQKERAEKKKAAAAAKKEKAAAKKEEAAAPAKVEKKTPAAKKKVAAPAKVEKKSATKPEKPAKEVKVATPAKTEKKAPAKKKVAAPAKVEKKAPAAKEVKAAAKTEKKPEKPATDGKAETENK